MPRAMMTSVLFVGSLLLASTVLARDTGSRDVLRLSNAELENGEWRVAIQVINDQPLAGLDIPIRFGRPDDPIVLKEVVFAPRVADWDFTHAQIDNQDKTVILGLISELVGTRPSPDLKVASRDGRDRIATLVLQVDGAHRPQFETFTTKSPSHELTYLYNDESSGRPEVRSYMPEFEVDVEFRSGAPTLPTEYALSDNYPNPFNPSTSFTLSLPEASDYSLRVFNIAGQLVKSVTGHAEAGMHELTWHGDNDQGRSVASGVYFLRVEAGTKFARTQKMMLLK